MVAGSGAYLVSWVPVSVPSAPLLIQLPVDGLEKAAEAAISAWANVSIRETRMKLQAPSFGPAHLQLLQPSGEWWKS